MENHKIIFSGPTGSGKTTAIAAISDIEPYFTDTYTAANAPRRAAASPTAMDYGRLTLDSGEHLHLYGTPGMARFDFNWNLLAGDSLGLVILVDSQRPDPMADLQFYLNVFAEFVRRHAIAVGISRSDLRPSLSIGDYQRALLEQRLNIPVFEVDARESVDVNMLLQALLYSLDPGIEQ